MKALLFGAGVLFVAVVVSSFTFFNSKTAPEENFLAQTSGVVRKTGVGTKKATVETSVLETPIKVEIQTNSSQPAYVEDQDKPTEDIKTELPAQETVIDQPVETNNEFQSAVTKTLENGQSDLEVIILQNLLKYEGLYSAEVTGYFGPLTKKALKSFQKKYGVTQSGITDESTRALLNSLVSAGNQI